MCRVVLSWPRLQNTKGLLLLRSHGCSGCLSLRTKLGCSVLCLLLNLGGVGEKMLRKLMLVCEYRLKGLRICSMLRFQLLHLHT